MRFNILLSLHMNDGTFFGELSGEIELVHLPQLGHGLSVIFPANEGCQPVDIDYSGILRVKDILHYPASLNLGTTLVLEEVAVPTKNDCIALAKYFSSGFGWFLRINEEI